MTLFYLEGPDASGKTTLINELMDEENDIFIHNGVYPSTADAIFRYDYQLFEYEQLMLNTSGKFNFFLDRGFMAENIYGPIMRDTRIEGPEYMKLLNKMIDLKVVLILCVPPIDTCVCVWSKRKEVEYVKNMENFMKIWEGYARLYRNPPLGIKSYHYDYTTDNGKIHEFIGGLK